MTETDITKNIPVCHIKIPTFEWTVQLEVRYRNCKKWASTTNGVKYTKEEKEMFDKSKEEFKEAVYKIVAIINIGNSSDMVTVHHSRSSPLIAQGPF